MGLTTNHNAMLTAEEYKNDILDAIDYARTGYPEGTDLDEAIREQLYQHEDSIYPHNARLVRVFTEYPNAFFDEGGEYDNENPNQSDCDIAAACMYADVQYALTWYDEERAVKRNAKELAS